MRVLIVEDNPIERLALEKLFRMSYPTEFSTVGLASDGHSAELQLEKSSWNLVMLDVNLPDVNGVDFIDRVNALRPDARIVMVTAYSDYEYLRQSIRKNVFDYILKPYSIGTFRECIGRFISQYWENSENYGSLSVAQRVYQYIEENYARQISLQEIADALDMDKSYIGRAFRKEFGCAIVEYLIRFRMDKAEGLILHGMNVSEAASAVGFSDPAYFGRCFKRIKGYPPKDARKQDDKSISSDFS